MTQWESSYLACPRSYVPQISKTEDFFKIPKTLKEEIRIAGDCETQQIKVINNQQQNKSAYLNSILGTHKKVEGRFPKNCPLTNL